MTIFTIGRWDEERAPLTLEQVLLDACAVVEAGLLRPDVLVLRPALYWCLRLHTGKPATRNARERRMLRRARRGIFAKPRDTLVIEWLARRLTTQEMTT